MNQPWVHPRLLSLEPPSHLPPHLIPLGCYQAPVWVPWVIQQVPIGYLFYIWLCMFPCYSFHTSHLLLPPLLRCVRKSVLYVCVLLKNNLAWNSVSPFILKTCLLFLLSCFLLFSGHSPLSCFLFLKSNYLHARSSNRWCWYYWSKDHTEKLAGGGRV